METHKIIIFKNKKLIKNPFLIKKYKKNKQKIDFFAYF